MDNTQITDPLTKKMFHSYIDEILIYYHKELQSDPNSIKRIRNIKYFTNKGYNQKREYSSLSGPQNIDKLEFCRIISKCHEKLQKCYVKHKRKRVQIEAKTLTRNI